MASPVPLVHVRRGGRLESIHRGSFVLVEGERVIASAGDPDVVTYYRSTAKPFQALPLVTTGAAERFGLAPEALALAAGSHSALPRHLAAVRSLLAKAGVPEDALRCGGHWSIDARRAREQAVECGADLEPPPRIWSNCSGKHAGMLAAARALGAPLEGYLDPSHPVQQEILAGIAAFAGVPRESVGLATDGCGAPIHAVPLAAMARSLARLGAPATLPERWAAAARRVGGAMHAHPEMVAGPGRFDTDLMVSARGTRLLSKGGAEGVLGVAVPEHGLGLAVKVEDGSDRGYRQLAIALLARRGLLAPDEAEALAERHGRTLRNWAGTVVGRLEVVV